MNYSASAASKAYASIGVQSAVEQASPLRLVQLLISGALDSAVRAKGHMERGQQALKANGLSRCASIIDGLNMSLDPGVDHEITRNLAELYDYMNRRLLHANLHNDAAAIDEVVGLLRELKEAWHGLSDVVEQRHAS